MFCVVTFSPLRNEVNANIARASTFYSTRCTTPNISVCAPGFLLSSHFRPFGEFVTRRSRTAPVPGEKNPQRVLFFTGGIVWALLLL